MEDRILAIHHSCQDCGYAFLQLPQEGGYFWSHSNGSAICPTDGFHMLAQQIWNRVDIERCYKGAGHGTPKQNL